MNPQILMVVDPDDVSNILGYYFQGQIYDDLRDIKMKRKEVLADTVFVKGKGIVNLLAERNKKLPMKSIFSKGKP